MYKRKFTGWDGTAYTAAMTTAGAFRITDSDGRLAKIGNQVCEGDVKGAFIEGRSDALVRCHSQVETLKDREAFEGSVKLQQRPGRTKQMGSHESFAPPICATPPTARRTVTRSEIRTVRPRTPELSTSGSRGNS